MIDEVILQRGTQTHVDLDADLLACVRASPSHMSPISERGGGDDWDAPLDLRVARPRAIDLRSVWRATSAPEPSQLAGAMGATRPILVVHTLTPFAIDGRSPAMPWGLGYEFVAHDIDADTVAVTPSNEVYEVGRLGQKVVFGIDASGRFALAEGSADSNVGVRASTNQRFQFEAVLTLTLRKVVGAPVGVGGAQWKMYRQNEPLDQPHTLLQLALIPEQATELRCTIKTWAKQAGRLGTRWGAKFWPYGDQSFVVRLA